MQPQAVSHSTCRYTVFRYVTDHVHGMSVPVGVAIWRRDRDEVHLRFIRDNETVRGAASAEARQLIRTTEMRLKRWLTEGGLPYAGKDIHPSSDEWWQVLADLLALRTQVGRPLAIDCVKPSEEIEALFEAVVAPRASARARAGRAGGRPHGGRAAVSAQPAGGGLD